MIELRDYQDDLLARTGQAMRRHKRVLVQLPTGGGKTAIATAMAGRFAQRQQQVWFIVHRQELLQQTSLTFARFGVPHGIIAAGYPMNMRAMVQICSIDTLKGRLEKLPAPRLAIVDEAHHGGAGGWALVMAWLVENGAHVVGLSATPWRLDGSGLGAHFDEMVIGPAVAWLMARGALSGYEMFVPAGGMDVQGVGKRGGDFIASDVEARQDKPKLIGDIIQHWKKHADGKLTIGFATSIAFSQFMAAQFNAQGIPAAHLDGGTPKGERARIMRDFAENRLRVLWNKSLFGEGLDIAAIAQRDVTIDAVIDAAPTQSLSWYLQKVGRGLRPAPGKTAILLDHAGNSNRHGFPDDEREWTLDGREKGRKAANDEGPPPPVTCEGCWRQMRRPTPECCPHCGKRMVAEAKPMEVADGELGRADEAHKAAVRLRLKQEQAACKDLPSLVALFARRGSKNPQYQAMKVMQSRNGKVRKVA